MSNPAPSINIILLLVVSHSGSAVTDMGAGAGALRMGSIVNWLFFIELDSKNFFEIKSG